MISLTEWAQEKTQTVEEHSLRLLFVKEAEFDRASQNLARVLPEHYVIGQHLSRTFELLGKPEVASLLELHFPRDNKSRSGECGEILATEYIRERTDYIVPINRLQWKDSREMSLRGDDVIGIRETCDNDVLQFLKAESKSRISLGFATMKEVRKKLDSDNGFPSAHGLSFIAQRLLEAENENLSDAITKSMLSSNLTQDQVQHLAFVLTGNNPIRYLRKFLKKYRGKVSQIAVGLQISTHSDFVERVFRLARQMYEP